MEPVNIILESATKMGESFLAHLPKILIALIVLFITWLIYRLVDRVLNSFFRRIRLRDSLSELFRKLSYIFIWLIGVMVAAVIIFPDFTPAKLLTVIGLSSIAIGFAFKDIFENFLAGILILLREPFQLRDFIECEGMEGFVEDINIRDTYIRRVDGQRIVIPNAMLFKNPVQVRTDLDLRRITVMCGVAYGEDVDESRAVIKEAVEGLDSVDNSREVQIFAQAFGASSIDFEVTWWTGSSPLEIRKSRDEVVAAVKGALDEAGIEIPFPYRTLTFKEPLETVFSKKNTETENDKEDKATEFASGGEKRPA
ncbi:MAG: mechanosensitive ion channel family protein [Deltaproteobacteria bacterium]